MSQKTSMPPLNKPVFTSSAGFAPPVPSWAKSYVKSIEFQSVREFLHAHMGQPGERLQPLTEDEVMEQARAVAANCTIDTVAATMQMQAELKVYRRKYGHLAGSPFTPGSTFEVTILDGCRFRPAVGVRETRPAA